MKNSVYRFQFLSLLLLFLFGIIGCEEFEDPPTIYNPDQEYTQSPVINNIIPSDSAIAGVREIVIQGENFAADGSDTNWVKIGGIDAEIKSLSENEIVVYRPSSFGEGLSITVTIPSAVSLASIEDYKVEQPIIEHGDFSGDPYALFSIEADKDDNLYIGTRREIQKLTPDGVFLTTVGEYPSAFAKITDLKFGPDGYLYAAISKKEIYKIDINTGVESEYVALPKTAEKIDFDANNNLYAVRRDGIIVVTPDLSINETLIYDGETVNEIRVFDNYLYAALDETLSRNPIIDNQGTLGETEVIVDLTTLSDFSVSEISSFNFDEDGRILLAIKNHPTHSVFVVENNGAVAPFYNAKIIPMAVDQIVYGNSRYIYLNRGSLDNDSLRVFKMGMDKLGAPYLGRN